MFDNLQINIPGGLDFDIPKMIKVKQNFEDHKIEDVALAVKNEILKLSENDISLEIQNFSKKLYNKYE